jgi:hypothetical protein
MAVRLSFSTQHHVNAHVQHYSSQDLAADSYAPGWLATGQAVLPLMWQWLLLLLLLHGLVMFLLMCT